jgi:hypothetical protein
MLKLCNGMHICKIEFFFVNVYFRLLTTASWSMLIGSVINMNTKSKKFPLHAMEAFGEREGIAPSHA